VAQRVLSLSAMWQMGNWREAHFRLYAKNDLLQEIENDKFFFAPLYLIALCSNSPVDEKIPEESSSFYFDTANIERQKELHEWALRLETEIKRHKEVIEDLQRQQAERTRWALELEAELEERTRWFGTWRNRSKATRHAFAHWKQNSRNALDGHFLFNRT